MVGWLVSWRVESPRPAGAQRRRTQAPQSILPSYMFLHAFEKKYFYPLRFLQLRRARVRAPKL